MNDDRVALPSNEHGGPVRVRDMPWRDVMKLLRNIGGEVAILAQRGEKTALAVRARYQYAHDHPTDRQANFELRVAIEDYIARELRVAEVAELTVRFGHRIEEQLNPGQLVPPSGRQQ